MKKTLAKDEIGNLKKLRAQLVDEIDGALGKLRASMEQIQRHHYYKLGELFAQLRATFKGKGNIEFGKFCKEHWPTISQYSRNEYAIYWKKVSGGKLPSIAAAMDGRNAAQAFVDSLPPLRQTTQPQRNRQTEPDIAYTRIVNGEVDDPKAFAVPQSKREQENELVLELAEKIINAGFRVLAVKLHPDKNGGSNEAMRRLNKAKKMLEDTLVRAELMLD